MLRTEYPSSLPVSSSSKTINTPKRPAKEVIGQIHRRLSSSTFDSPTGRTSSIPLRVPSSTSKVPSSSYYQQRPAHLMPQSLHQPQQSRYDRRSSYTTGQEPFVNQKTVRKSAINSPHYQQHQHQYGLGQVAHQVVQEPPKRHYQYHQAPSSPVATVPARPLSFSRPRSARASVSPLGEPLSSNEQEAIPPVPPLPEQLTIGKYRQIPTHPRINNNSRDRTSPRRNSHQSYDTSSKQHSHRNSSSGVMKVPKSQTINDLTALNYDTKHQMPAKSPHRPLNRPALLHPHQNSQRTSPPDEPSSASLIDKNRLRSKSTAPKQAWLIPPPIPAAAAAEANANRNNNIGGGGGAMGHLPMVPRSSQTSATATRRMIFSPFKKRLASTGQKPAGPQPFPTHSSPHSHSYSQAAPPPQQPQQRAQAPSIPPQPPVHSVLATPSPSTKSPDSDFYEEDDEHEREIQDIMKRLVTNKPGDGHTRKREEEVRKLGPQVSMTPAIATKNYRLNLYEKGEILDFRKVYFCGRPEAKKMSGDIRRSVGNYGFDDEKGGYKVVPGDHIAYRYEIMSLLGKGSFGKVVKCLDHKTGKLVAVKMIINRKRFHMQALVEADILRSLSANDPKDRHHLIRYTDHFNFRDHLCIATELLGINLYELIKYNQYKGLPSTLVKNFTKQMLEGLKFLDANKIIHCDLKPENVLVSDPERGKIKIIDFGSSCFENERVYTYIQSRFYRSPEVMLGMSYNQQIDVWSLGCIVAELLMGRPLFMGENEQEQVACIMELFGVPDKTMISRCARRKLFFDQMGNPRMKTKEKRYPNSRNLSQELKTRDPVLLDFVAACLVWNPKSRVTAGRALNHEWITGMPDLPPIPTPPPSFSAYPHLNHQYKASPRQMQQRDTPRREMRWR